jgi:hypothetical protein
MLCFTLLFLTISCATTQGQAGASNSPQSLPQQTGTSGEQTQAHNQRAKKKGIWGAVIGGLAGAVLGGVIGGKKGAAEGAALGAALGGAIGYSIGHHEDKMLANRDALIAKWGYCPQEKVFKSAGPLTVSPEAIKPGQTVVLHYKYIAFPKNENVTPEIGYCEFIQLPDSQNKQPLEKGQCPIPATGLVPGGGELEGSVPITVSKEAVPATYNLILETHWGNQVLTQTVPLTVAEVS